ncbi:MAG: phytoene desaturase family protein [Lamprobacter sp.]|uniref:1-hydroxycarotenoid 3,4-desaturase CrtD n=1 Tax=Lamprobacter sp. TaxID=3100796 RepID=UPI002B262205|nr:1-hydroxycarotenoid 3,4-desaturase CrtD [Lamprobacter sp.]MEA3638491.1 phytoene desaturase family protein [Lamprobacter sp.]
MRTDRVVIVGAGIGGLTAAIELAARGLDVTVLERAGGPGGKLREIAVGDRRIDAGPTVFTMRWVFEAICEAAGTSLEAEVALEKADVLARHAWSADQRLDLFADLERSADAVAAFAGPAERERFLAFSEDAKAIYRTLKEPFISATRPSPVGLVRRVGPGGLGGLINIKPFATLWSALSQHFHDPRLRQLFGRYATYCGSSPYAAPATLMLVAHVEQDGVWLVKDGMHQLAQAFARLAGRLGARFRYHAQVDEIELERGRVNGVRLANDERIPADAVIINGDTNAVAAGLFGHRIRRAVPPTPAAERSLSAITWNLVAKTDGFPLSRHTVFFSDDYQAEFDDILNRKRLPRAPTVYICAQDRDAHDGPAPNDAERLLCLVNAPAIGDTHPFHRSEIDQCAQSTFALLERCGLKIQLDPAQTQVTTPAMFERLFPATGGALYGRASHGWMASFSRPGARTKVPGLYLAGGSTHPGPGVPMAALSGRLAAASLTADRVSIRR